MVAAGSLVADRGRRGRGEEGVGGASFAAVVGGRNAAVGVVVRGPVVRRVAFPSLLVVAGLQVGRREPLPGRRACAQLGRRGALPCRPFCRRTVLISRDQAGSGRAYSRPRRRRRRRRRRIGRHIPWTARWWGRVRSLGGRGGDRSVRRCRRGSARRGGGRGCRGRGLRRRRGVFVCPLRPGGWVLSLVLSSKGKRGRGNRIPCSHELAFHTTAPDS